MSKSKQRNADDFLSYRTLEVRSNTISEEDRSIEVTVSTETPVPMFDWERYEMVPEILRSDGAVLPQSRQVPLLDNHNRYSTDAQLGSTRNLKKETASVAGRATFSTTAEREWTKVREGHITDVSAGYQVLERTFVPKGTTQIIKGREYTGPVSVVTKWKLREVSITPIGADEQAKMRGLNLDNAPKPQKEWKMNEQLRAFLVARGMPETLNDEEAVKWADEHRNDEATDETGKEPIKTETRKEPENTPDIQKLIDTALNARLEGLETARRALRSEVDTLCELSDIPQGERAAFYDLGDSAKAREAILKHKKDRQTDVGGGYRFEYVSSGKDTTRAALQTAFVERAINNVTNNEESHKKAFPVEQRSKDAHHFRYASMLDIATECLKIDGYDVRGLTREQIAIAALGFPQAAGVNSRASFDPAYHVTGSFPKLTQDAINKSMMIGYTETPSTWRGPMRQAESVADFKLIHRMRIGAMPNLPSWPDNSPLENVSLKDAEETYRVDLKGYKLSLSYRLVINDDMSVTSRFPSMFGAAANRTVNAVAWAQITSNPTMEDGQTLFLETPASNRKRKNLTTGAGAPSVTTIGALTNLMRQMRGENTPEQNESQDILNLQPVYIVAPSALEVVVGQQVNSLYDPSSSTGHGVYNPNRVLTPVIEPLLDVASTTAWYLFASPSQIDTVEVTFLQGHETPVARNWSDPETLSQNYAVMQAFAAKAVQHRGIQKHAGA